MSNHEKSTINFDGFADNMPVASDSSSRRQRTKTACDYCRKRKSKCNGECPCSNCLHFNRVCQYTNVPKERKKRVSKSTGREEAALNSSGKGSLSTLSTRLSTLESLLTNLTSKLDQSPTDSSPQLSNRTPEDRDSQSKSVVPKRAVLTNPKTIKALFTPRKVCFSQTKHRLKFYFGSHSIFGAFSEKSIQNLKDRLSRNDKMALPANNLQLAYSNAVDSSIDLWSDPDSPLSFADIKCYFCIKQRTLIFELLEKHYEDIYLANFLCDLNKVRELFQRYFYGIVSDIKSLERLGLSEYLVMHIALCLCISNVTSESLKDPDYSSLGKSDILALNSLRQDCVDNAIFCYSKLTLRCESVTTVQGIALLILFVEINYPSDFVMTHTLTSVMIKHGTALGLTHYGVYKEFSSQDAELRRRLVWFFDYLDIDYSYRTGNSLLLNYSDLTILNEYDDHFLSVPMDPFENDACYSGASKLIDNCRIHGYDYYHAYYVLVLNRLRIKSYAELFRAKAVVSTQDQLMDSLESINEQMNKLANMMEPEARPTMYYENTHTTSHLSEQMKNPKFRSSCLNFKLLYFSHLALINRVPFGLDEINSRLVDFGQISMDASRTVLHLVSNVSKQEMSKTFLNFIAFYPFMAFFGIFANTLTFPDHPGAHEDTMLLIRSSLNFFAYQDDGLECWQSRRLFDSKSTMTDLVTRVLLQLLLTSPEIRHDYSIEFPELVNHLRMCETIYPDLFKRSSEIETPLNLVFLNHRHHSAAPSSASERGTTAATEESAAKSGFMGPSTYPENYDSYNPFGTKAPPPTMPSSADSFFGEDLMNLDLVAEFEKNGSLDQFTDENFNAILYSQLVNMPGYMPMPGTPNGENPFQ